MKTRFFQTGLPVQEKSFCYLSQNFRVYIHDHTAISPQHSFGDVSLEHLVPSEAGKLMAIEPSLDDIPPGLLRRMSKAVRMGIGAGLPLLRAHVVNGIIIGTANGGMEDCIRFLNQIIDYDEGMLTPGNFVQSTPNAIAGQLSLATKNRHYNATHVHQGLAFENALADAGMFLNEYSDHAYLVGAVDEISTYNYNIDYLAGWYNKTLKSGQLYSPGHSGTIAGEGAAMFLLNNKSENAAGRIHGVYPLHTRDAGAVSNRLQELLQQFPAERGRTLFLSGENGDSRSQPFFQTCESLLKEMPVARFKHASGEYPTAASFALWLACYAFRHGLPDGFYKTDRRLRQIDHIILYNSYQGRQHSFIAVNKK